MKIHTRVELAFIGSFFPVMRAKMMPNDVWDEILLAIADEEVGCMKYPIIAWADKLFGIGQTS